MSIIVFFFFNSIENESDVLYVYQYMYILKYYCDSVSFFTKFHWRVRNETKCSRIILRVCCWKKKSGMPSSCDLNIYR